MQRRDFLAAAASLTLSGSVLSRATAAEEHGATCQTFASPQEAIASPREKLMFVSALRVGINDKQPDYLAVVDVDPASKTYSQVVERVMMPTPGDELHHFGWNACSSCHGDKDRMRRFLIVPGFTSGRIHVID